MCSVERDDQEVILSVEDILTFVTGASCFPPKGFDNPPQVFFLSRRCPLSYHMHQCVIDNNSPVHERCLYVFRMTEAIVGTP